MGETGCEDLVYNNHCPTPHESTLLQGREGVWWVGGWVHHDEDHSSYTTSLS